MGIACAFASSDDALKLAAPAGPVEAVFSGSYSGGVATHPPHQHPPTSNRTTDTPRQPTHPPDLAGIDKEVQSDHV